MLLVMSAGENNEMRRKHMLLGMITGKNKMEDLFDWKPQEFHGWSTEGEGRRWKGGLLLMKEHYAQIKDGRKTKHDEEEGEIKEHGL